MCETKEILISEHKEFEINMIVSSKKEFLTKDKVMNLWRKFVEKNNLVCGGTVEESEL